MVRDESVKWFGFCQARVQNSNSVAQICGVTTKSKKRKREREESVYVCVRVGCLSVSVSVSYLSLFCVSLSSLPPPTSLLSLPSSPLFPFFLFSYFLCMLRSRREFRNVLTTEPAASIFVSISISVSVSVLSLCICVCVCFYLCLFCVLCLPPSLLLSLCPLFSFFFLPFSSFFLPFFLLFVYVEVTEGVP